MLPLPVKKALTLVLYAAFVLSNAVHGVWAQGSNEVLTNASSILALSGDQASQGIKISIQGVVTAAEHTWGGRFFIQDSSGGVFVENISDDQPAPGDVLNVDGISYPGGYAPIISHPHWMKIGQAPLPAAKPVEIEQLMSGAEDGQRVEISGIVRQAQITDHLLQVDLASGGYRVRVYAPISSNIDPQKLVGAKVTVRGTPATAYNAPLRHLISVDVYVPLASDFVIEKSVTTDPFNEPLTLANNIAQYRTGRTVGDRVHVKGVVVYQRNGEDMFIRDASGGCKSKAASFSHYQKAMSLKPLVSRNSKISCLFYKMLFSKKRPTRRPMYRQPRLPIDRIITGHASLGLHHIRGKLLDRLEERSTSPAGQPDVKTILVLQNSNTMLPPRQKPPVQI